MKLRRLLCMLLCLTLLGTCALAADPLISSASEQKTYSVSQPNAIQLVRVWGSVTELGEQSLRLQNDNSQAAYSDIVLKITDDTRILDAVTGAKKAFSDLQKDATLDAYVSPAMTKSLPPQSNAVLILSGIPADFGVPTYAQIDQITSREDGGVDLLMSDDVILHLQKDTKITAYGGASVSLEDLKPGTMLLSWYQVVALSEPAQATPDQIMVFPYTYDGYLSAVPGALSVNGKAVVLTDSARPFAQDGTLMLPVRKTAEALGCTVEWDNAGRRVLVSKGDSILYTVSLNDNTASRGDGASSTALSAPPILENGVTFLAAEDLLVLQNVKLAAS